MKSNITPLIVAIATAVVCLLIMTAPHDRNQTSVKNAVPEKPEENSPLQIAVNSLDADPQTVRISYTYGGEENGVVTFVATIRYKKKDKGDQREYTTVFDGRISKSPPPN